MEIKKKSNARYVVWRGGIQPFTDYFTSNICPGLNANEIQIPYEKHHKVSSLVKIHQKTHDSVKYEVI